MLTFCASMRILYRDQPTTHIVDGIDVSHTMSAVRYAIWCSGAAAPVIAALR